MARLNPITALRNAYDCFAHAKKCLQEEILVSVQGLQYPFDGILYVSMNKFDYYNGVFMSKARKLTHRFNDASSDAANLIAYLRRRREFLASRGKQHNMVAFPVQQSEHNVAVPGPTLEQKSAASLRGSSQQAAFYTDPANLNPVAARDGGVAHATEEQDMDASPAPAKRARIDNKAALDMGSPEFRSRPK